MTIKEYYIPSKTGICDLYVRSWIPDNEIKGAFQIAHGMAEHVMRYEEMASSLCNAGFAVFADDHIGHGKSVKSKDDLGYFGDRDGWNAFVEDERQVTELIKAEHAGKPIIFYGHSMGSFIAREYLRRYSFDSDIKGSIICGTAGKNPAAGFAINLTNALISSKGAKYKAEFLDSIAFGTYNSKISNPRTKFDWLTHDESIVDKYIADEYCGFLFTVAGFRDLFTLLSKVNESKWFTSVNRHLPILLVAGEEDPVGSYGKGVKQVFTGLKLAGIKDLTLKLYPNMRHEIHNEIEREKVFKDLVTWSSNKIK